MDGDEPTILVCGLGAFGQAVLTRLLPFDVALRVLDLRIPDWRTPGVRFRVWGQIVKQMLWGH